MSKSKTVNFRVPQDVYGILLNKLEQGKYATMTGVILESLKKDATIQSLENQLVEIKTACNQKLDDAVNTINEMNSINKDISKQLSKVDQNSEEMKRVIVHLSQVIDSKLEEPQGLGDRVKEFFTKK